MITKLTRKAPVFRKTFDFLSKDVAHYFPSHMAKGMMRMQHKMKQVDCILEVHDARIPLSGRNPEFAGYLSIRPHLLLLNKSDLVQGNDTVVSELHTRDGNLQKVIYTDCKSQGHNAIRKVIPAVVDVMTGSSRFNRAEEEDFNLLVIGIPNVGKSSLINALRHTYTRKGKATKVGGIAGITKSVLERIKICHNPPIYVLDSPGILAPKVESMEVGMKLALCATLQDHMIGEELIADYMLFWLNKHQHFSYVSHFKLAEPTDQIYDMLAHIAQSQSLVQKYRTSSGYEFRPNFTRAAQIVLRAFRDGSLGRYNLDIDQIEQFSQEATQHREVT